MSAVILYIQHQVHAIVCPRWKLVQLSKMTVRFSGRPYYSVNSQAITKFCNHYYPVLCQQTWKCREIPVIRPFDRLNYAIFRIDAKWLENWAYKI